jgi:hypothetical protein
MTPQSTSRTETLPTPDFNSDEYLLAAMAEYRAAADARARVEASRYDRDLPPHNID